jgi:hypothetical protein
MRETTTRRVLLTCAALLLPLGLSAAQPAGDMPQRCKDMMAQHEEMAAEMKQADERLRDLVTRMNAASGEAKIDAVAATVTELVTQRTAMHERMMRQQEQMMQHMGQHMQDGASSMQQCPMMRGGMHKQPRQP